MLKKNESDEDQYGLNMITDVLRLLPSPSSFINQLKTPQFIIVTIIFIIIEILIGSFKVDYNWHFLSVYFFLTCAFTPLATTARMYFKGDVEETSTDSGSSFLLGTSAFISWIFAKSVINASILGGSFGIVGGFGYAAYYISFASASAIIYKLRMKGYRSLPEAINERYGSFALFSFALALLYRLYNEVWSNSIVVAGFYGDHDSSQWWVAAIVTTLIPLLYVLAGGLKSSLYSDILQALIFVVFVFGTIGVICTKLNNNEKLRAYLNEYHTSSTFGRYNPKGTSANRNMLSLEGGIDLLVVGALQGALSYPLFDPVLTDRCFLTHPRTMARSFTVGGTVAGAFIVIFSIIGIYGSMLGNCVAAGVCDSSDLHGASLTDVKRGDPAAVSHTMGDAVFSVVNIIMMTSSISTLDSTFSSTAKLIGPDIAGYFSGGKPLPLFQATTFHMHIGRLAMIIIAIVGTLMLLSNPAALDATTVSGTVIMGLGAPIYMLAVVPEQFLWKRGEKRPLAFLAPFYIGVILGICYQIRYSTKNSDGSLKYPHLLIDFSNLAIGSGSYGLLLGVNVLGAVLSIALWFVFGLNDYCFFNDHDHAAYEIADTETESENDHHDIETVKVSCDKTYEMHDLQPEKINIEIYANPKNESKDDEPKPEEESVPNLPSQQEAQSHHDDTKADCIIQ